MTMLAALDVDVHQARTILAELALHLTRGQQVVLMGLFAVSGIAGLVHWAVVAHVTRLKHELEVTERLFPFGFGWWHHGMLRRSWYPAEGARFHRWAISTYAINIIVFAAFFVLLVVWGGFH